MNTVKPISPSEVGVNKSSVIPEWIIAAVNEAITRKWNGTSAKFKQDDLIQTLLDLWPENDSMTNTQRTTRIFDQSWLDFESLYETVGWKVEYDKPGYNETYPATFTFRPVGGKR